MAAQDKSSSDEFQKLRVCPKIGYDEWAFPAFLANKPRYP